MTGEWIRFGLTALCVLAGCFALLTAMVGLFRFDFTLNRLHAASIADTLGLSLLVLAVMLAVYSLYQYLLKPGRIFDRDPMLHREVRFRFNGEDIARQDSEVAVLLDWRVSKVWRNRDFYFLFEGKESYILLPRWAFGSAEEEKQFERLVLVANPGVAWRNFG